MRVTDKRIELLPPQLNARKIRLDGIFTRDKGCSGQDQAPDEQKESGDEDHKFEANHRNKDEPDDQAEWLMISLTASNSTRDEVFGRDTLTRVGELTGVYGY